MVVREFSFDKIGKELKERVEKVKESEIKENIMDWQTGIFRGVEYQEYKKAQELKQSLLNDYKGKLLEEVIDGEECITEGGTIYKIETDTTLTVKMVSPEDARKRILGNLKLIYGIGEKTERVLKAEGYKTIEDLRDHPQFGAEAAQFLKLDMHDICSLMNWIGHWLPLSHPLILYSSSFHNKEDFVILDIETMGLFSLPIIVVGVAQISDSHLLLTQYLLRTINEEPGALSGLLNHTHGNILVTFNGKTFDIPYIRERLAYYRLKGTLENPHFDLLHFSRRAWKDRVPDCRLHTLEEHLFGIKRNNDVPSALVPDFYDTYMKTGNIGPLIPILEHNRQDMITLANIFSRLHEEWK